MRDGALRGSGGTGLSPLSPRLAPRLVLVAPAQGSRLDAVGSEGDLCLFSPLGVGGGKKSALCIVAEGFALFFISLFLLVSAGGC